MQTDTQMKTGFPKFGTLPNINASTGTPIPSIGDFNAILEKAATMATQNFHDPVILGNFYSQLSSLWGMYVVNAGKKVANA